MHTLLDLGAQIQFTLTPAAPRRFWQKRTHPSLHLLVTIPEQTLRASLPYFDLRFAALALELIGPDDTAPAEYQVQIGNPAEMRYPTSRGSIISLDPWSPDSTPLPLVAFEAGPIPLARYPMAEHITTNRATARLVLHLGAELHFLTEAVVGSDSFPLRHDPTAHGVRQFVRVSDLHAAAPESIGRFDAGLGAPSEDERARLDALYGRDSRSMTRMHAPYGLREVKIPWILSDRSQLEKLRGADLSNLEGNMVHRQILAQNDQP